MRLFPLRLIPARVRAVCAVLLVAPLASSALRAQGFPCDRLPASSNEAKMLEFFAAPLAFGVIDQPQRQPTGLTTLVLELSQVPEAPSALRTTQCFTADKSQNANLSSLLPRPRLIVALPWGMQVEAAYLPPVTVGDATPNIVQGALAWTGRAGTLAGNPVRLQVRGHLTRGDVRGPVTCPRSALRNDPLAACYGTAPSKDRYRPNVTGAEAIVGVDAAGYGYFIGAGVNSLNPWLQVDFTNGAGFRDTSRVIAPRMTQFPVIFGGTLRFTDQLALLGQYYVVPGVSSLFRVSLALRPF
ncbi:MAG: hypothetical protein SFW08_04870 [Gemmatimonadaceae bacterium]|nr:hypothetical protein [Gemmatimonadaceae bacterium]